MSADHRPRRHRERRRGDGERRARRRWGVRLIEPMTPVDEFLGSVREVFAENRAGDWTRAGLVVAGAVALSINLGWWIGRRKRRLATARRVEALAATAGLSG